MLRLGDRAAAIAAMVPPELVDQLSEMSREERGSALALQRRLSLRGDVASSLAGLLADTQDSASSDIAVALLQAAQAGRRQALPANRAELVWTGPALSSVRARQTAETLRDLVAGARNEVLLAGYAFSGGARALIDQLSAAASQGVRVWIVANEPSQLRPFRKRIGARVRLSTLADADSTTAIHAKVTAVDRAQLLITSANFTYRGFTGNVELGALISGPLAEDAVRLFEHLAKLGIIQDVPA